jgi:hypothetical protein
MKLKCIVKGCENHKDEGGFEDGICLPCYLFITTGEGIYSQAYRNSKPADLTDKEILEIITKVSKEQGLVWLGDKVIFPFARAILRKAQEK